MEEQTGLRSVDAQGQRSARPFNAKRNRFDMATEAEFAGATPGAIKSWLMRNQRNADGSTRALNA